MPRIGGTFERTGDNSLPDGTHFLSEPSPNKRKGRVKRQLNDRFIAETASRASLASARAPSNRPREAASGLHPSPNLAADDCLGCPDFDGGRKLNFAAIIVGGGRYGTEGLRAGVSATRSGSG